MTEHREGYSPRVDPRYGTAHAVAAEEPWGRFPEPLSAVHALCGRLVEVGFYPFDLDGERNCKRCERAARQAS